MHCREAFDELLQRYAECRDLSGSAALLSWDQETLMPKGGARARASQRSTLAGIHHERFADPRMGELLAVCEENEGGVLTDEEFAAVREVRLDYEQTVRLPKQLVQELASATSAALHAWQEARPKSDFSALKSHLETVVGLVREKASALHNGSGPLYDALLNIFERNATSAALAEMFAQLKARLVPLVEAVRAKTEEADPMLGGTFAEDLQCRLGLAVIQKMGFDLVRGRVDQSAHPFCSSMGHGDTRLTQRFDRADLRPSLFGIMHEAGHGLYEQGLPERWARHPLGEAVSLGIHESQSRLWENMVGRSKSFWRFLLPEVKRLFPHLKELDVDQAHRAVNRVRPSFIRVEADEVTYNLHIILRFELEQALFAEEINVGDLPAAWNTGMQDLLGLTPADDANGCLQDIHWPMGAFGYFSTYTLGNLYAAQLYEAARRDLPDLEPQFIEGEFTPLKEWLRTHIHHHGRRYPASELIEKATGNPPDHEPLISYLTEKLGEVYGIEPV